MRADVVETKSFKCILPLVPPVVVAMVACLAVFAAAAAAVPTWTPLPRPWSDGVAVTDVCAAEPSLVAVAGDDGSVAVSTTGGASWTMRPPSAQGYTADLGGIAFADAAHGVVVGAGGTALVTSDGGRGWRVPVWLGAPATADLNDVALSGSMGAAVGDGGVVLESTTSGESWRALDSPVSTDLLCVACTADGTIVAGGADGSVLVRRGRAWHVTGAGAPVTSVTARPATQAVESDITIVASTGWQVLGSVDGRAFSVLLTSVYAGQPLWPAVAWNHVPTDELLIAGPASVASYFAVARDEWTDGVDGLGDVRTAVTTPPQSVGFVLDTSGLVARTLSSGREPATLTPSAAIITAGASVALRPTVSIAAPGELALERRLVGGPWQVTQRTAWASSDWGRSPGLSATPRLTADYRLSFTYGGVASVVSPVRRVTVRPRLTPDQARITVRRGTSYRFKGTVFPALRGESVRLFTDRGGAWHRIRLGGVAELRRGTRWVSRLFGTPARETYHLRASIAATSRHAAARSVTVTVIVR